MTFQVRFNPKHVIKLYQYMVVVAKLLIVVIIIIIYDIFIGHTLSDTSVTWLHNFSCLESGGSVLFDNLLKHCVTIQFQISNFCQPSPYSEHGI